jgi:hypothetical protein
MNYTSISSLSISDWGRLNTSVVGDLVQGMGIDHLAASKKYYDIFRLEQFV